MGSANRLQSDETKFVSYRNSIINISILKNKESLLKVKELQQTLTTDKLI